MTPVRIDGYVDVGVRPLLFAAFLVVGLLAIAPAALAADEPPPSVAVPDRAVFGFGGALTSGDMAKSANPFGVDYEDHPVFGLGYQLFPYSIGETRLGLEVGIAGRFGGRTTAEFWGGVVARYDGFVIADRIRVSPAVTVGFSVVTRAHEGRERRLEEESEDGDARFLFYLGPEIAVSFADDPNLELFWRLHHRSGAGGTLGNMNGASNANVIGFRYKF